MKQLPQTNPHATTNAIQTATRTRVWRIGLLVTTIVLGFLLVTLGIIEYRDARKNGLRITEAQVMYMMLGFQKQLRRRQEPQTELTQSLYDSLQEQGVHRVALYEGTVLLHGFGTSQFPIRPDTFAPVDAPVAVHFITDDLVHARVTLPPPQPLLRGRGLRRGANRMHQPERAVLLELVPKEAIILADRAFQIMILDMMAAILLMGAAVVFWKQSVRQDLLQTQLEKDRQLKLLGQMSAVLGHELKNTIASVKGHSQLLAEKLTGTAHESSISLVVKDTLYLQSLTEQMLQFARTGEMNVEKVYLDDLAEAAVTFSDARDVKIILAETMPTFWLDRHKMQQVLTNLLNNAHQADATEISLHMNAGKGDALILKVTDNGRGMKPEQLENIFDPFFTTRARGTGLGLALSRRIVEAHGGTIIARSDENQGCTFTIEIPSAGNPERHHS